MPYLGIFALDFESNIEISTLDSAYMQNFAKKQKCLNLGPKMYYLFFFWAGILKKLLSYLKSAPRNLPDWKISRKNKNA